MLTRWFLAFVTAGAAVLMGAATAYAEDGCPPGWVTGPMTGGGSICIYASEPGTSPSSGADPGPVPASHGSEPGCQRNDGSAVDCVNQWGVWVSSQQCWGHPVNMPADHPAWEGHTDGEVWMCALIDDTTPTTTFWVPPGGPASPLPDPGELAQQAMGLLRLETAEIHLAPAYPDPTIVGVENWLWLPEGQWRPLTKTVTAGGTSVTVTARPENVLWDMGPELTTCFDAGRPWRAGMGDEAVTRCGYTYRETSHRTRMLAAGS